MNKREGSGLRSHRVNKRDRWGCGVNQNRFKSEGGIAHFER